MATVYCGEDMLLYFAFAKECPYLLAPLNSQSNGKEGAARAGKAVLIYVKGIFLLIRDFFDLQ